MENQTTLIKPADKSLTEYAEEGMKNLMKKHGAFYAFSDQQFDEQKEDGIEYSSLGYGTICPTDNCEQLVKDKVALFDDCIAQDLKDHGEDRIILRELINHEAFYTGQISDTMEALKVYSAITKIKVIAVYNAHRHLYAEQ